MRSWYKQLSNDIIEKEKTEMDLLIRQFSL